MVLAAGEIYSLCIGKKVPRGGAINLFLSFVIFCVIVELVSKISLKRVFSHTIGSDTFPNIARTSFSKDNT